MGYFDWVCMETIVRHLPSLLLVFPRSAFAVAITFHPTTQISSNFLVEFLLGFDLAISLLHTSTGLQIIMFLIEPFLTSSHLLMVYNAHLATCTD